MKEHLKMLTNRETLVFMHNNNRFAHAYDNEKGFWRI
jgi:hypothetical protein